MTDRQRTDPSGPGGGTVDASEPLGAVLDLGHVEPLVDLRDQPSISFDGQPGREASVPTGQLDAAATGSVERRDAIQRSRFVAVVLIAVLNMFDLITTYVAIAQGAHEGNPIVAWMISSRAVVLAKILICGWLIVSVVVAKNQRRRVTLAGLCTAWAVVGVYSLVVVINTLTVWSLRH